MKIEHRTPTSSARRLLLLVLVGLACVPATVAGAPAEPCGRPFVFSGADVNTVVLPYRFAGSREKALKRTGEQIAFVVHLEAFFSMIKYGSIGGVRLVEDLDSPGCDPDTVYAQLLGMRDGAAAEVGEDKALVLIWGRVYEDGDDIFVQSYLRFVRRGIEETIDLAIGDQRLRGSLPFQAVSFPPRKLTRADLKRIELEAVSAARLRDDRRGRQQGQEIPLDYSKPKRYGVVEVDQRWVKVRDHDSGSDGWIKASRDPDEWSLRMMLPELAFVDGLVGYLGFRVGSSSGRTAAKTVGWATEAFRLYEKLEPSGSQEPLALSHSLVGFLTVLEREASVPALRRAAPDFEAAAGLISYNASARNLDLIAEVYLGYAGRGPALRQRTVAEQLLTTAALEPSNEVLLANLATVYRLFMEDDRFSADPDYVLDKTQIEQQLKLIEKVVVEKKR